MKVRELKDHLSKLNPDLDVHCMSEDEQLLGEGRGFIIFEIEEVSKTDAERTRLKDNTPYLKLGKSQASVEIAIIQISSDF